MGADGEKWVSYHPSQQDWGRCLISLAEGSPLLLSVLSPLYHPIFPISFLSPYKEIKCIFISHSQSYSIQFCLWSIGTPASVYLAGSPVILVLPDMSFVLAFYWVKGHLGKSCASH